MPDQDQASFKVPVLVHSVSSEWCRRLAAEAFGGFATQPWGSELRTRSSQDTADYQLKLFTPLA